MRTCINCNSDKTEIRYDRVKPREIWYKYNDGYICSKCRLKLLYHPKWNPIYGPRRLQYKNKRVLLKDNPRKGICEWCGKIGKTNIHHIEYHDNDILKDTIELCPRCHRIETIRLSSRR